MRIRLALLAGLVLALAIGPGTAFGAPDRQVILVVLEGISYEEVLSIPLLSDLAGAGALGLMTTSGGADLASRTAVSLGAGGSVPKTPGGPVPFERSGAAVTVDVAPYGADAEGAVPGLLGSALSEAGMSVAYLDPSSDEGRAAMLAAMDRAGRIPATRLGTAPAAAAADPTTGIIAEADLLVSPDPGIVPLTLGSSEADEVLVLVVGAGASRAMRERGEEVTPIILARGSPEELLTGGGEAAGLTSSTTRREGVVAEADVAPTILGFLGVPAPSEMAGSAIRLSGAPPAELHERYLAYQRVVGPIGLAALAFAIATLVAGIVLIFGPWRPPAWLAGGVAAATLGSAALLVALVPAGVLPSYSAGAVVLALIVAASVLSTVARRVGRDDAPTAVATVAAAGLLVVLLDGVLGWPSGLTPMIGGSALDGERFFGLGNAYAGLVLAGAVLGAARLPLWPGVGLIVAMALFAGLPFLGADLGGCLTLALAAALWFGLRRWQTLGWRTWALAAATLVAALVLVIAADRILPGGGTHLSEVAEPGEGVLDGLGLLVERLGENVATTSETPAAWLAVLGLPIWLTVALGRPRRLRPTLEPDPRWRDAVVALAIAGIAGYLLNDTHGMAGVTFTFVSAAMLYPTLTRLGAAER